MAGAKWFSFYHDPDKYDCARQHLAAATKLGIWFILLPKIINAQLRGNNPGGCATIVVASNRFSFPHESDNYDCARWKIATDTSLGIRFIILSEMTNTQPRGNNPGGCATIVVARVRFSFAQESDDYDCARGNIPTDTILGIRPFELLEMSNVQ